MVNVTTTDDLVTDSGDLDPTVSAAILSTLHNVDAPTERVPNARQAGKRGRSAFAASICEFHPTYHDADGNFIVATLEEPCAKFSHLPGNGVGPYKPSIGRKTRSFFVGLIKPVMLIGFVLLSLYCAKLFLPHIFSLHSFVPGGNITNSTNTNGNGDSNSGTGHVPQPSPTAGQRQSPTNHKLSNSGNHSHSATTVNPRGSRS